MLCKSAVNIIGVTYIERTIDKALKNVNKITHNEKSPLCEGFCGPDGTRTRDLLRDRQAF